MTIGRGMTVESKKIAKEIDKDIRLKVKAGMNIRKTDIRYKYSLYPSLSVFVFKALEELGYTEYPRHITTPTARKPDSV